MKCLYGLIAASGLLLTQNLFGGNVWHVNNQAVNASDSNPGTEAEPFLTINAATTNEHFEAGDTVLVYPGVYNSGKAVSTYLTRVLIPKKTYLRAVGNAENTIIEGALGTDSYNLGNNALRCIVIGDGGAGTEVKGFTLRNGATKNADGTATGSGGGVLSSPADAYIVDCVISNCAAFKGGGIYGGTAVRSFFYKNSAYGPNTGNSGSAANNANLFCCVIDSCSGARANDLNAALSESIPVNCTIVNCKTGIFISKNSKNKRQAYNCVFSGIAGNDTAGYAVLNKCTTTANQGAYQLIGPGVGDYRLVSAIGGETLGCAATQAATTL
jgi:hypothetical protein